MMMVLGSARPSLRLEVGGASYSTVAALGASCTLRPLLTVSSSTTHGSPAHPAHTDILPKVWISPCCAVQESNGYYHHHHYH